MLRRLLGAEAFRRLSMQALLLLGMAILISGVVMFAYDLSLPYAGFEVAGATGVGSIDPLGPAASAGLRMDDQIVDIRSDGQPGGAYLHPGQDALQLVVLRGGEELTLEIDLVAAPDKATLNKLGYYFMALTYWVIAMTVLVFKPRDQVSQFFVLVALLGTFGIVVWRMADIGAFWANLVMPGVALAVGPIFVHYHTLFPQRVTFRHRRPLLAVLYAASLVLLLLSTTSDLVYLYRQAHDLGSGPPSLAAPIKVYFIVCFVIGLALLIWTLLRSPSETSKRQSALILLGTAMATLPLMVFVLMPQVLHIRYTIPSWISLLMLAFLPLSYLYGMYRHNVMKLDRIVNRTVVYFFLTVALVPLYFGLFAGIRFLLPGAFSGTGIVETGAAAILGLSIPFLSHRIQILVDHAFYGGWYNYESFISDISPAFNEAVDMETITNLLTENVARALRLKGIVLLLLEKDNVFRIKGGFGFEDVAPVAGSNALASWLFQHSTVTPHSLLCHSLSDDLAAQMELAAWRDTEAEMWVPLIHQGKPVGILVLANKLADEFFTWEDHRILDTLAHQAGVAIGRTQLFDQLEGQFHETRALTKQVIALQGRNQQRLSDELHHNVAQDLVHVLHLLEEPIQVHSPKKIVGARDVIQNTVHYLRDLMFELRPPSLGDDLNQALQEHVASVRRKRQLPVDLYVSGNGVPVPEDVRVVVFQICQESLNNAWKHAHADRVYVTLDLQPESVYLEVKDDGNGFVVPDHLGNFIDQQHLGLVIMQERARGVGGSFELESAPRRGTRISVRVPLSPAS
ncbi:MAG: GAF domain-containing protein [Anaerolineae bacterium]|nr:GAF domain-containing protein [Anaerolineae bacterium]